MYNHLNKCRKRTLTIKTLSKLRIEGNFFYVRGSYEKKSKGYYRTYNNQNKRLIVRLISSVKNTDEAVSDFGDK